MRKFIGLFFLALILTLLSSLIIWIPAIAQTSDPPPPEPLILTDGQNEYSLGLHMEILEDPDGKLTIDEVTSPEFDSRFVPSESNAPTYGYTNSVYWVRFRLRNENPLTDHWLLEVVFANTHYVDLYLPTPGGEGFITKQSGVLRPFNTRYIPYHHIVFNLPLEPDTEQTYYMRFQSGASMTLRLIVWFPEAFFHAGAEEQLILGLFYGVLLIILVYNLFLWFTLREAIYLYYEFFLASAILFFVSYDALANQYLWRDQFVLINYSVPLFFILSLASITLFADAFLDIRARHPKLHKLIVLVMAGWGITLLLMPFVSYHTIFNLIARFGAISLGLVVAAGFISWRSGYRSARYFMVAWLGLLLGVLVLILVRLGFGPSTTFTEQFLRVGIIWLVAFWAIALADRINLLRSEKEKANLKAQASETRYQQVVETMNDGLTVTDETGRLAYVNNRMAKMLGYSPEELIGHLILDFIAEDNKRIINDQLALRQAGATTSYEIRMVRNDGSDLFVIVSPMPVFEDGSRYKGSISVVTDITDRVRAGRLLEQRIAERTRELSTLLDLSHEITSELGLDSLLTRILERLQTIVNYHKAVMLVSEKEGWKIRACWPASSGEVEDLFLSSATASRLEQVLEPGKPFLLNTLTDDEEDGARTSDQQTLAAWLSQLFQADDHPCLGTPIAKENRLIGSLILSCTGQAGFSDDQVKVAAAFANQAAIMIENNQLLDQVKAVAAADERNRLARDLHDSVTQVLFSASTAAEVLPQIWQRDPKQGIEGLKELRRLIRGALAEMRTLLVELRPSAILKTPLSELLTQLTESVSSRTELSFQIYIEKVPVLPAEVQTTFYRVAQEAINNVVKHSRTNQIWVSLNVTPTFAANYTEDWQGDVKLVVSDNGSGFTPEGSQTGHFGLGIMRERAAAIHATLNIESQPGHGTTVTLTWRH